MSLHTPAVSVVIPCHDDGKYLDEAVDSVLNQTYDDVQIIVIDDGSTEESTVRLLEEYERPKTKLIRTAHKGLATARNIGIRACESRYILPLDADDKIKETYLEKAVGIIQANDRIGIVYCNAELFGTEYGPWELRPYRFPEILHGNMIFCSALFRRSDWETVNGYNPNMVHGWEDYDFWLSLIELGRGVCCIPESLFCYRRRPDSMLEKMTDEEVISSYSQLFCNHPRLYAENIGTLMANLQRLTNLSRSQEHRIHELEAIIRAIERSLSWRGTKSLRQTAAKLRELFRGEVAD
jgi:glycosyltransferase involved in cell wall biosynthesis